MAYTPLNATDTLPIGRTTINGNFTQLFAVVTSAGVASDTILTDGLGDSVLTNTTPTVVDTFATTYKGAKYVVLIEQTTSTYYVESVELLVAHDGSTLYVTPYAMTSTSGSSMCSFDASYSGGTLQLVATNLTANTITVSFQRILMKGHV